ncbi:MAG: fibronectin type III domain-containing protein [Propionibacteriaceae bacterium]|nr:fibronectin type III domain-containing protein [Propionibacteriaceae bacterium]
MLRKLIASAAAFAVLGFGLVSVSAAQAAPDAAPSIITSVLPEGEIGHTYKRKLTATGTPSPGWTIVSGSLPDGLSLSSWSGEISGTPTKTGVFDFIIEASNESGSDTESLMIKVVADSGTSTDVPVDDPFTVPTVPEYPVEPVTAIDLTGEHLTIPDVVYTGKELTHSVKVYLGTHELFADVDYTVEAAGPNTAIGDAAVTVTGVNAYAGVVTVHFNIIPKAVKISKLTVGKKQVTVKWAKAAGDVSKYQVSYRLKGSSAWKTKTVDGSKTSLVIKSLKKGKVYQFRVRSYKTVSKISYTSAWSAVKASAKVK